MNYLSRYLKKQILKFRVGFPFFFKNFCEIGGLTIVLQEGLAKFGYRLLEREFKIFRKTVNFLATSWKAMSKYVVQRHVQLRPDSLVRRKYSSSSTHVRDGYRAFQGANLLFISHKAFLSWVVGRRRSFWLSTCSVSRTKVQQLRNLI
jgi:hypothetical protein